MNAPLGKGPVSVSIVTLALPSTTPRTLEGDDEATADGASDANKFSISFQSPFGNQTKDIPAAKAMATLKTIHWDDNNAFEGGAPDELSV